MTSDPAIVEAGSFDVEDFESEFELGPVQSRRWHHAGVEAFAMERDLSMVQVALGWLLAQEAVPSVTPGATTAEQVASNVRAADWAPSSDDLAELEKVLAG